MLKADLDGIDSSPRLSVATRRLIRGASILLLMLSALATVIGAYGATHLRMLNDDYWHAFVAQRGFIGAMKEWWVTTSGDLFAMGSNTLLNGLPLIHFPWPFTSFVPYMTTFIVVGITGVLVIARFATWRGIGVQYALASGLLISFMWWVFLWTPLISSDSARRQLVLGITHWQNLNTAYIIPPATLLVLGLALGRKRLATGIGSFLSLVLGILVGLTGMVIGTSVVITLFLVGMTILLSKFTIGKNQLVQGTFVMVGTIMGLIISISSPGSRNRASQIGPEFDTSITGIFSLTQVFIQGAFDLFQSIWHPGTLLVVLIIFPLVAITQRLLDFSVASGHLWATSSLLIAFAFIYATVNRLSEVWIGASWWHTTTLQLIVFLALITASFALGLDVSHRLNSRQIITLSALSVACGLVGVGAVQVSTQSMIEREKEWSVGPAVIDLLGWDIDEVTGWQFFYWNKIMEFRDTPDRMGFLNE